MTDLLTKFAALKRPPLLINAARIGTTAYRRETHLARHLDETPPCDSYGALFKLMEIEQELNEMRLTHAASYSVARHVDVMIAMMTEARLLRLNQDDPESPERRAVQ